MKTGLALSGGGAMGAAHIGILETLEQEKIKINCISGTSAGAIVALLYADGGLEAVNNFFNDVAESSLVKRSTILLKRNETIFSMIEDFLSKNVKAQSFEELQLKFTCIATDISTGKPVILKTGNPVKAAMASAAYPGVFPPQKLENDFLVDGGLTINLPITVLKDMGADFVIGSSLYAVPRLEIETESNLKINLLATAVRSIDIMSKVIADQEIKNCDFCFEPPVETYSWYHFAKIFEIRELGQKYASEKIGLLKKEITKYKQVQKQNKSIWQSIFSR